MYITAITQWEVDENGLESLMEKENLSTMEVAILLELIDQDVEAQEEYIADAIADGEDEPAAKAAEAVKMLKELRAKLRLVKNEG